MSVRSDTINITTSTAGAFEQTNATPGDYLAHVVYAAGGNLSSDASLTITDNDTGMTLYSKADMSSTSGFTATPRRPITVFDGSDSTTEYDRIAVTPRYKVAITGATASDQTGTLKVVFSDD